jgi:hypothetical protein
MNRKLYKVTLVIPVVLIVLAAACAPAATPVPTATPTSTPTPPPTATATPTPTPTHLPGLRTGWTTFTAAAAVLEDRNLRAIAVAPDGTLWLGTDMGVLRFDGDTWET